MLPLRSGLETYRRRLCVPDVPIGHGLEIENVENGTVIGTTMTDTEGAGVAKGAKERGCIETATEETEIGIETETGIDGASVTARGIASTGKEVIVVTVTMRDLVTMRRLENGEGNEATKGMKAMKITTSKKGPRGKEVMMALNRHFQLLLFLLAFHHHHLLLMIALVVVGNVPGMLTVNIATKAERPVIPEMSSMTRLSTKIESVDIKRAVRQRVRPP